MKDLRFCGSTTSYDKETGTSSLRWKTETGKTNRGEQRLPWQYHEGLSAERILLIPSTHASIKKSTAWHQRPYAGCVVLALLALMACIGLVLPTFESPGNITVYRVSEADVKIREGAGWAEALADPPESARAVVTLAIRQVGPGSHCPPRCSTQFGASFLELNGIL